MKMKRKRIETTSGAEDWGDPDVGGGLAVDTDRPVVVDATTASLRAQVTGVTKAEQVTAYFEWRDTTADDNWVLNRDNWNETTKVPLTSPGPFKAEVTDLDPDAKYEVRAVAEADDEQYTGETLIYPDDATTETGVDVEAVKEELPEISRSTGSRSGTDSSEPDSSSDQFCPECGSAIQQNNDFCQSCGNEIKDLFKNRELPDAEVNNEERRHKAFGTDSESQPLEAQTNCPACGARISVDQENCDYCGELLVESTAEQRSDKP